MHAGAGGADATPVRTGDLLVAPVLVEAQDECDATVAGERHPRYQVWSISGMPVGGGSSTSSIRARSSAARCRQVRHSRTNVVRRIPRGARRWRTVGASGRTRPAPAPRPRAWEPTNSTPSRTGMALPAVHVGEGTGGRTTRSTPGRRPRPITWPATPASRGGTARLGDELLLGVLRPRPRVGRLDLQRAAAAAASQRGQPPVGVAEQLHRRGHEHDADDGRVDGDRDREAEPDELQRAQVGRRRSCRTRTP